ncbi:thrombospondin type 3 repeat-containing protein [Belliella aquatica]|nr:thrombospondin type 3 repeat-containing protein [Belliella aquatica]
MDENGCALSQKDSDNDGVTDDRDLCPDTPQGAEVDENGCALSQKDSDNDGVTDDLDLCPDTPQGAEVDENGCALSQKDSDNDGVTDDRDLCPDTPQGAEVDENGCALSQKDSDNDGVTDDLDLCPDTPQGAEVDENGCALSQKDSDNDGVTDDRDLCPDTPQGAEVDENGCALSQKDSDNDGITDDRDLCPDTPQGAEVDENGCALSQKDSDNDGVTDDLDLCPDTPQGAEVDENGCALSQKDSDNDGVTDDLDLCPDTPEGAEVDENGCALSQKDSDNDGVTDDLDLCPDTPQGAEVDENGCALFQKDSDNDGVTDDVDLCPDTPEGEEVDQFGCSINEITPTIVVDYDNQEVITVPWGTGFTDLELPTSIWVTLENGERVFLPVTWLISEFDGNQSGVYVLIGVITFPNSYIDEIDREVSITVIVLQKDPPTDLLLSNDNFLHNDINNPIYVGDFTVIDPIDDTHLIELVSDAGDNDLFVIIDGQLFWNNSDLRPGEETFTIVVLVTDRDGNTFTKEFVINRRIPSLEELDIPNTFTPDGDGINDTWGINSLRIYNGIRLTIFEKGGQLIFRTNNPDERWDGKYFGDELPVGAYFYILEKEDLSQNRKGVINLLRRK